MKKNLLFLLISAALILTSCSKQDEGNYSNGSTQANISYLGNNISFYNPTSVALDTSGNVYVADFRNNLIREINTTGVGSTLAGTGAVGNANGAPSVASFNLPTGVALDIYGNVYVADSNNNLIREISTSGVVSTFAGTGAQGAANGAASAATFNYPEGIAVDTLGNVYVADYGNNMIREISAAGVVTTLAGNGTAGANNAVDTAATFYEPASVAVDVSGNVYVADYICGQRGQRCS
jgi:sugar lactone lactonase YvrE